MESPLPLLWDRSAKCSRSLQVLDLLFQPNSQDLVVNPLRSQAYNLPAFPLKSFLSPLSSFIYIQRQTTHLHELFFYSTFPTSTYLFTEYRKCVHFLFLRSCYRSLCLPPSSPLVFTSGMIRPNPPTPIPAKLVLSSGTT